MSIFCVSSVLVALLRSFKLPCYRDLNFLGVTVKDLFDNNNNKKISGICNAFGQSLIVVDDFRNVFN